MSGHAKEIFHAVKGKAKEILGEITGNEIKKYQGEKEKLAGHLEQKYDISYEEAELEAARLIVAEQKNLNY